MKKYNFRLEAILKLRRLKEENCRTELGKLLTGLQQIENQIEHDHLQINDYYSVQEANLKNGMRGGQIQTFPMLIFAKEKNIQLLMREKTTQERLIEEKKRELASLRGEMKMIENLKEKDYHEFRKKLNKETDQKIEEQTQNWLLHRDRKV